jgi:hypothetical protein
MRSALALLALLTVASAHAACEKPWIMFDTGNTLIKVPSLPSGDPDFDHLSNLPGAVSYLKELNDAGYPVGIIVNLGPTDGDGIPAADPRTSQVLYLVNFIAQGWVDPVKFPWNRFGRIEGSGARRRFIGRIYVGRSEEERKPATGTKSVLQQALNAVKKAGCKAVYMGESDKEMVAAEKVGFIPFWVGHTDHSYDPKKPLKGGFWIREKHIQPYIASYQDGNWEKGF